MSDGQLIRDLIYFDFDKAASIVSQIEGGMIEEFHDEEGSSRDIGGGLDVRLAKIGGSATDTTSKLVVKSVHHDLLVRVEEALFEKKVALDINTILTEGIDEIDVLREMITESPYIRAEGFCRFNDYERMKRFISGIEMLANFQIGSAFHGTSKVDEYYALQEAIDQQVRQVAAATDQHKQRSAKTKLGKLTDKKKTLESELSLHRIDENLPSWLADSLNEFIDLFMPRRNTFILQPNDKFESFKIISNLKRECIVDSDWEHVVFAYGSQPNVKLSVFGLVTSMPEPSQSKPNPFVSDAAQPTNNGIRQLTHAFTSAFDGIHPFEQIGQITWYPSVTVYPIAVYHSINVKDQ